MPKIFIAVLSLRSASASQEYASSTQKFQPPCRRLGGLRVRNLLSPRAAIPEVPPPTIAASPCSYPIRFLPVQIPRLFVYLKFRNAAILRKLSDSLATTI